MSDSDVKMFCPGCGKKLNLSPGVKNQRCSRCDVKIVDVARDTIPGFVHVRFVFSPYDKGRAIHAMEET